MADAAQAYYTTSYTFGTGTTSTAALMMWRALSHELETKGLPMTGVDLAVVSGLTPDQIARYFVQTYYQRYYGFRRFDTLEEFDAWAKESGVLYVPGAVPEVDEDEEEYEEDDDDEAEEDDD